MKPSFREEKKLWKKGYKKVACLDEAGRGPIAGPVVAAAVMILNPKFKALNPKCRFYRASSTKSGQYQNSKSKYQNVFRALNFGRLDLFRISDLGFGTSKLRDSKKLSPKLREKFYKILTTHSGIKWGIGRVSEKIIDKINIKNAAELAMEKAVEKLKTKPDFLIIDGKHLKNYKLKTINYKLIVKADEKVFSCAAASILAKVFRDRIMEKYHQKYPRYGFNLHKGYPTKLHKKMLQKYGPCKIHRKTFKPVRKLKAKSVKRKTTAKN